MKKPEKKEACTYVMITNVEHEIGKDAFNHGYNQACDDLERFLPSEKEMGNIVAKYMFFYQEHYRTYGKIGTNFDHTCDNIAKAISKRIGKETKYTTEDWIKNARNPKGGTANLKKNRKHNLI